MKTFLLLTIILFSQASLANQLFSCVNTVGENEVEITATYIEKIVGGILTIRRLKSINVIAEGVEQYSKKYSLLGKTLGGESVEIDKGVEVQVFSDRMEVIYNDILYILECTHQ